VTASLLVLAGIGGCASAPPVENHTFFQSDEPTTAGPNAFEVPFAALDLPAAAGGSPYVGVTILGGAVRLSRPASWHVRRASSAPGRKFVEYVSPHEYLFAVYERPDSAGASWTDIEGAYEAETAKHVEWLGKGIPIAGWDTQGREYVLRRKVKGQRAAYENTSREFLFRGRHSVATVALVHQGLSDAAIEPELLRTIQTLSVL
jgi:hypothetical protein